MLNKTITVNNTIEAKNVALIVQTAGAFKSSIKIKLENKTANAKSMMGLIALGDFNKQEINIIAEGEDEEQAIEELLKLFL